MKLKVALAGLATSALVLLSGCGNGPPPDQGTGGGGGGGGTSSSGVALVDTGTPATKVAQTDALKFEPNTISVKVGDVVEFDNTGSIVHNVTFDAGAASNGNMSGGDKALFKFSAAGTYKYQCTLHAGMTGTVTVG
ncbi:MAG TPA: plastocyanin/azurin family copper-binding protein [Candidatus Dormibacteraeota bacterium]